MWLTWLGFFVSLATILVVSRKNLALGISGGALVLGLFTLPLGTLWQQIVVTLTDPSIVLLALAMGLIPLLGGIMKQSGQIDDLVENVRLPRRYMLPFSAALMGLLPMPGGALLSAPILEKAGEGVPRDLVAAINNWFRHLFILVYPLSSALIVAAKIVELDIYHAILYVLPALALATGLGYFFFLRLVQGDIRHDRAFSLGHLMRPLVVILVAPVLDFTLKRLFDLGSLATLIGVAAGLTLSLVLASQRPDLRRIIREMTPWNFALIIVGMFLYLHVFRAGHAGAAIAGLPLPPLLLALVAGFGLSFLTGRVQLPASIILPAYLATTAFVTPPVFACIYVAIYFGYIISPVHPCLVVTCEYFGVSIRRMIARLAVPTLIVFALTVVLALLID